LTEKLTNKYIAIVSLKDYHDVPFKAFNEVLHIPLNLVITEVFYHHSNDKAAEHLKHQNYILKISEDEEMQEWCYLNRPGLARRTVAVEANGKFIVVTLFGEASQADAGYRTYAGISSEWLSCIAEGSTTHEVFSLF
jgi:hypothetical protein